MDKPTFRSVAELLNNAFKLEKCIRSLFLAILVLLSCGCGSDPPTPSPIVTSSPGDIVPPQQEKVLATYRFTAAVDQGSLEGAGIYAEYGDTVSGTFSYYTTPEYVQVPPGGINFTINSFHFISEVTEFMEAGMSVINDDVSLLPVRDEVHLFGGDAVAKAALGALNVQAFLLFRDLTAQALYDESIPQSLDLAKFPYADLFLNVTMPDARYVGGLTYSLGAKIVSLERVL